MARIAPRLSRPPAQQRSIADTDCCPLHVRYSSCWLTRGNPEMSDYFRHENATQVINPLMTVSWAPKCLSPSASPFSHRPTLQLIVRVTSATPNIKAEHPSHNDTAPCPLSKRRELRAEMPKAMRRSRDTAGIICGSYLEPKYEAFQRLELLLSTVTQICNSLDPRGIFGGSHTAGCRVDWVKHNISAPRGPYHAKGALRTVCEHTTTVVKGKDTLLHRGRLCPFFGVPGLHQKPKLVWISRRKYIVMKHMPPKNQDKRLSYTCDAHREPRGIFHLPGAARSHMPHIASSLWQPGRRAGGRRWVHVRKGGRKKRTTKRRTTKR